MESTNRFLNFIKKPIFSYGIFWSWNAIFLVFLVSLEVETSFLFGLLKNTWIGFHPIDFGLYSLLIFLIPFGSIGLGLTVLRKRPHQLLKLFYGVEVPLTLLFILRLTVFRELTAGTMHLFLLLAIGMVSFLVEILVQPEKTPTGLAYLLRIGHSMLLIIGVYIGAVLIFYSAPITWEIIKEFFKFEWFEPFTESFLAYVGALLFILSSTLIVFLPLALPILYTQAFIKKFKEKIPFGKGAMIASLAANILLIFLLNNTQSQTKTFEFLESDFSKIENREKLIKNEKSIKTGLMNAYLNSDRYLSSIKRNNHIKELYKHSFGLTTEQAEKCQDLDNFVLRPFLYDGDAYNDVSKAKDLYQSFFDQSIQKAEQDRVVHAIRSHWGREDIEAGLLNVNEEQVHILRQEISVTEHNDAAEIEIYEVYQNKTFDQQEIFYYFSLPENAVFTGLWLSDEAEIEKKYKYVVSPRGAAQEVYKAEVKRRVDPSLLEQVGPNQYRLRAFPIEPKRKERGDTWRGGDYEVIEAPEFHLWLTYKTLVSPEGQWELPQLNERRNVYWDNSTVLSVNGEKIKKADSWLPRTIKTQNASALQTHIVQLNDSLQVQIAPKELTALKQADNPKIGLLIDGSYSMKEQKESLTSFLNDLDELSFEESNLQTFVMGENVTKYSRRELEEAITQRKDLFFGSNNFTDMVQDFSTLGIEDQFDLLLMVSDQGNYESETDEAKIIQLTTPLFLMHIGEKRAPIYSDAFLETIQNSKGGVIANLEDLQARLWQAQPQNANVLAWKNGVEYTPIFKGANSADPFYQPLAAKYFIESREIGDSNRIAELDAIHRIALTEGIVSPYSSMIVLVNDRQKKALKEAEEREDRFDREIESGEEVKSKGNDPFNVTGTPEPHEWILLSMVIAFLLYGYWRKKTRNRLGF